MLIYREYTQIYFILKQISWRGNNKSIAHTCWLCLHRPLSSAPLQNRLSDIVFVYGTIKHTKQQRHFSECPRNYRNDTKCAIYKLACNLSAFMRAEVYLRYDLNKQFYPNSKGSSSKFVQKLKAKN